MKKLFTMAAIAAMSLTACTNKANTAEESLDFEEATPEAVVSSLAEKVQSGDATAITEAVETVQAELQEIVENGDVEKAAAYASQIKAFVEQNASKLQELNVNTLTLSDIINAVQALPAAAESTAQDAAAAVESDAVAAKDAAVEAAKSQADAAAVDAGKAQVNQAVQNAQNKANEAVQDAQNKANEAVQNAQNKANEAVQGAANQANQAINDAVKKLQGQ